MSDTGLSLAAFCCFVINYILGAGFLSLPHAFASAGMVSGTVLSLIITAAAIASVNLLVDASARATDEFAIRRLLSHDPTDEDEQLSLLAAERSFLRGDPDGEDLLAEASSVGTRGEKRRRRRRKSRSGSETTSPSELSFDPTRFEIQRGRQHEVVTLCRGYLGSVGEVAWIITLWGYMFGTAWGYAAVFSSSVANLFLVEGEICSPEDIVFLGRCWLYPYVMVVVLFALLVVPLSCLELREQAALQVGMAIFRVAALLLMLFSLVLWKLDDTDAFHDLANSTSTSTEMPMFGTTLGVVEIIPVLLFSQILHHSVPPLLEAIEDKSKAKLGFSLALCFTCSIYVVLGTAFVAIFTSKGKTIYASVNQQWSYFYTNAASRESLTPFERAVTTLLRLVIVLFPALDVMSAYPLMAVTLGNNLEALFDRRSANSGGAVAGQSSNNDGSSVTSNHGTARPFRLWCRLLASVPPLIGVVFQNNLSTIIAYVGLFGVFIILVFPPLLSRRSVEASLARHGEAGRFTPYSDVTTLPTAAGAMLAVGAVVFVLAFSTRVLCDTGVLNHC